MARTFVLKSFNSTRLARTPVYNQSAVEWPAPVKVGTIGLFTRQPTFQLMADLVCSVYPFLDQVLDHRRIGQRADVPKIAEIVGSDFA